MTTTSDPALLDTNVLSEVRKGKRCDPNVAAWFASVDDGDLYLSVLVWTILRPRVALYLMPICVPWGSVLWPRATLHAIT